MGKRKNGKTENVFPAGWEQHPVNNKLLQARTSCPVWVRVDRLPSVRCQSTPRFQREDPYQRTMTIWKKKEKCRSRDSNSSLCRATGVNVSNTQTCMPPNDHLTEKSRAVVS